MDWSFYIVAALVAFMPIVGLSLSYLSLHADDKRRHDRLKCSREQRKLLYYLLKKSLEKDSSWKKGEFETFNPELGISIWFASGWPFLRIELPFACKPFSAKESFMLQRTINKIPKEQKVYFSEEFGFKTSFPERGYPYEFETLLSLLTRM